MTTVKIVPRDRETAHWYEMYRWAVTQFGQNNFRANAWTFQFEKEEDAAFFSLKWNGT